jgi:hypothetical protein
VTRLKVDKWGHRLNVNPPTPAEQATADAARAESDAATAAMGQPHHCQASQRTAAEQAALEPTEGDTRCSS